MVTTEFARETDEKLAELHTQRDRASNAVHSHFDTLHYQLGHKKEYRGRAYTWKVSASQAYDEATLVVTEYSDDYPAHAISAMVRVLRAIDEGRALIETAETEIVKLDVIYARDPWPRFFPCLNRDGHIHRTLRGCSSVYPTTPMGWRPDLSGRTQAEAVADLGEALCTFCFPDAPSDWKSKTLGQVKDERTRVEREAAKAAREAAKAAKNLTAEEIFEDENGWKVTTVAGCKKVIRDEMESKAYYPSYYAGHEAAFLAATANAVRILLSRGVTQEEIDKIISNTDKRLKREMG